MLATKYMHENGFTVVSELRNKGKISRRTNHPSYSAAASEWSSLYQLWALTKSHHASSLSSLVMMTCFMLIPGCLTDSSSCRAVTGMGAKHSSTGTPLHQSTKSPCLAWIVMHCTRQSDMHSSKRVRSRMTYRRDGLVRLEVKGRP